MGIGGRFGRAQWGAPGVGVGTRSRTAPSTWKLPRRWNREQEALVNNARLIGEVPPARFVFCASPADVFDNAVPTEWRRDLFDLIRETPHLTWLLLTKRPQMIEHLYGEAMMDPPDGGSGHHWPANAAIGCTVVNQEEADRDIPHLLAAKAALGPAFAFLSMEPLLGPVDISPWLTVGIDWTICGGETDQGEHKARPANPEWFRSLRDQCAAADVPLHFKQWGEWQPFCGQVSMNTIAEVAHMPGASVWKFGKAHDPETLDGVLHRARPEVRR